MIVKEVKKKTRDSILQFVMHDRIINLFGWKALKEEFNYVIILLTWSFQLKKYKNILYPWKYYICKY